MKRSKLGRPLPVKCLHKKCTKAMPANHAKLNCNSFLNQRSSWHASPLFLTACPVAWTLSMVLVIVIDLIVVSVAQLLDIVFAARTLYVVFIPVVVGRDLRTANPVVSILALPPLLDADHRDHRHDRRGAGHVQPDQRVHLGGGRFCSNCL